MLILSREVGQALIINDDITVLVEEIKRDKVRLGVSVPRDTCTVTRREVYAAIRSSAGLEQRFSTIMIPDSGMEALDEICSRFNSPPKDLGQLISTILRAVAFGDVSADEFRKLDGKP